MTAPLVAMGRGGDTGGVVGGGGVAWVQHCNPIPTPSTTRDIPEFRSDLFPIDNLSRSEARDKMHPHIHLHLNLSPKRQTRCV